MAITRNAVASPTPVSATSINVPFPTNAVGDILLMFVATGSSPTATPSGWTQVGTATTVTGAALYVYWMPVAAVQSGTVTVSFAASSPLRAAMVSYSGADTTAAPAFTASTGGPSTAIAGASRAYGANYIVWANGRSAASTLTAEAASTGTWTASEAYENSGTNALTVTDGAYTGTTTALTATSTASVSWNSLMLSLAVPSASNFSASPALSGTGGLGASGTAIIPGYASDTFTGSSGAAWSSQWAKPAGTSGTATIAATGTSGQIVLAAAHPVDAREDLTTVPCPAILDTYVDVQALSTGSFVTVGWGDLSGSDARSGNGYEAVLYFNGASSKISIGQFIGGVETKPATDVTLTTASSTWYTLHLQYDGTNLRAKFYAQGAAEPGTWTITGVMPTPASLPSTGYVSLGAFQGNSTSRTTGYDNLLVSPSSTVTTSVGLGGTGTLGEPVSVGFTPAPFAFGGSGSLGASTSFTGGAGDGSTPASILGIGPNSGQSHFAVQVAQSGAASIDTYDQNQIAAGLNLPPYFMAVTDGGGVDRVQFQVPMDGPDTSGATTPRIELRELDQTGANMAFDVSTGTHRLHGRSTITHLAAVKPETVIAQLHNGSSDRISIRTQVISGSTKLLVRVNGSAVTPRLMDPYVLGTEFEWKIEVVNGVGYVYFNDMTTPVITTVAMTPTAGVSTWYFKAGDYAQSSTPTDGESPADNDTVLLRDLWHWHTGWPDPLVAPGQAPSVTGTATFTGTGGLSSVSTPRPAASAPLSGLGSLATAPTPKPVTTVALTGTGSLSAAAAPKPSVTVSLSGSGTMSASGSATQASTGTATLSGSGTLVGSASPAPAVTVPLSGLGSLSATSAPNPVASVALSGAGGLSGTGTPKPASAVAFSAAGTLAQAAAPAVQAAIAVSGTGSLASSAAASSPGAASINGTGSLAAGAVPAVAIAVALSGGGSLAPATAPNPAVTVSLSGTGGVTAGSSPKPATTVSLSGSGALSRNASITVVTTVALAGSGSLVGAPLVGTSGVAPFTGVGTVTTSQVPKPSTTVSFAGIGGLAGLAAPKPITTTALSGSGSLIPAGLPNWSATVALSGSGGLAQVGIRTLFGLPAFTGEGGLSEGAVAFQRFVFTVIGVHGAQVLPAGPLGQLHGNSIGAATNHTTLSARLSGSPITGGTS